MDILEIIGTLTGLLYLYWEYKASAWLWLASIAMPAIYLSVYFEAGLYADFAISIYYIIASVYGLLVWIRHRRHERENEKDVVKIRSTPKREVPVLAAVGLLLLFLLGFILKRFTDSSVPWGDALTTALSIVALWMLAQKYIEQWIVWCVADFAYAFLYAYKDLWLTAALYMIYAVVAIFGYFKWKKLEKNSGSSL